MQEKLIRLFYGIINLNLKCRRYVVIVCLSSQCFKDINVMYFKKCASAEFPQTRISNANARAYTMKMWKKVAGNEYNSALMFSAKEFSSFF